MHRKLLFILLLLPVAGFCQQRPRIGVTLSGGGAKGLAHIGILKAIDSAGLKVDYVTGTSMGSIIGGLYAVGYSADTLEKIARSIDWESLLRDQANLPTLFMEEKEEASRYVVELPWVNHKFHLSTGLLEGQELWLKFSELFFPVYQVKDFSQFSIPFRCISTDVGTGEAVVLSKGEIASALRSSMAIPSVFTAMDYDGHRLVDGGIVRNFPVKDVKDMGADIVIGSNVTTGLLAAEKVGNVFQILLQVAFYRESEDNKKEVPLCDIYVPFHLEEYNMGSFADANEILENGIAEGRRLYPRLKRLADSLNAIYGKQPLTVNRLPAVQDVRITTVKINGLKKTTAEFFLHTMDFSVNRSYTPKELVAKVRRAYGTRYYERILYSLEPKEDGSCAIVFDVMENPLTFAKIGLHYSRFTGIGVIGNFTTRNFVTPNSRSLVSMNLGESFRVRAEHLQYIGRLKNFALRLGTQFDRFDVMAYEQFKKTGLYTQNYWDVSEQLHYSGNRSVLVGIGHRFEWLHYNPTILPEVAIKGRNQFSSFFTIIQHNTLDKSVLPGKGIKIQAEGGRTARQSPRVSFLVHGREPDNSDSIQLSDQPFLYVNGSAEGYLPVGKRTTAFLLAQTGINFNYSRNVMNEYIVGGMVPLFRHQILFAGLLEGAVYSPAAAMVQGGVRTRLFHNAYITGRANVLFNNFISRSDFFSGKDFYSGYALTFTYNFALGPLELSAMYCDQTKKVQTYINIGIPF